MISKEDQEKRTAIVLDIACDLLADMVERKIPEDEVPMVLAAVVIAIGRIIQDTDQGFDGFLAFHAMSIKQMMTLEMSDETRARMRAEVETRLDEIHGVDSLLMMTPASDRVQ